MTLRRNTISSSISINRGLIQANPTSLPPQPIGEATKASNLRRIPPGVQGRSHFTYFLYLIVQNTNTSLKTQSCSEFFPLLLPDPQKGGWTDSPQELSIPGVSSKSPLSRYCPPSIDRQRQLEDIHKLHARRKKDTNHYTRNQIPGDDTSPCFTTIQTMVTILTKMADETQAGIRKAVKSSSKDGLAALVNKLDAKFCEGPHLDKDCPLNEEVKQVEEVKYGEFGRTTPFNGNNGGKFRVGPPGYLH
ncbi:hypothetical protein Tco_0206679 [Tanacetum coccineum]